MIVESNTVLICGEVLIREILPFLFHGDAVKKKYRTRKTEEKVGSEIT